MVGQNLFNRTFSIHKNLQIVRDTFEIEIEDIGIVLSHLTAAILNIFHQYTIFQALK